MTASVSLLGLFGPAGGGRDMKANEDDILASFAGVLANVSQANAQLLVPPKTVDGTPELTAFETADDASAPGDDKAANDATAGDAGTRTLTTATQPLALVTSSIAALDPVLQEKLSRVMSRMRDETGHDPQITETYRAQSRQDMLYAQGRQTPGPVVTWTQHSKHTQGRAVDVTLDEGHASLDAYTTLQRIANEEGLRTLGSRDPGHLELPSATIEQVTEVGGTPVRDPRLAPTTSVKPLAVRDSTVAVPAQVARVARVARIATIASTAPSQETLEVNHVPAARGEGPPITNGLFEISDLWQLHEALSAARLENGSLPQDAARAHVDSRVQAPNAGAKTQTTATGAPAQADVPITGRSNAGGQRFSQERGKSNDRDNSGYGASIGLRERSTMQFSVTDVATDIASTATARAERIMAATEDAPARPLSQIVMSVDAGNGTTDRIQVAMRGSTVSATIDAADIHAAHAMRAHSDELAHALTRDGVEVESIRVRSATAVASSVGTIDSSQRSSDSSTGSRFERGSSWEQQRSQQRSNDERRQQQRNQRGGQES